MNEEFDIKTLLRFSSENIIDPLPIEKFSSKDES
jgi:hypothetical protein